MTMIMMMTSKKMSEKNENKGLSKVLMWTYKIMHKAL